MNERDTMGILSGKSTETALLELMEKCTSFSVAVAWATVNDVFEAVKKYEKKLDYMIVGVDFYQTHPDVLNWMKKNKKKGMFVGNSKNGIFHPKIFLFEFDDKENNTLVIGSANLTAAAFSRNEEASVRLKVTKEDSSAATLIATWARSGIPIASFNTDEYRTDYLVKGRAVRQALNSRKSKEFKENPDLLELSFDEYYLLCTKDPFHYFKDRLDLLDFCARPNLSHDEFCCVAGIKSLRPVGELGLEYYGLFGSMGADAAFRDTVKHEKHWVGLHTLYQSVSPIGKVTNATAKSFIENVEAHVNAYFGNKYEKKNHLSAATRLLALRRPDLFFCVNGANGKRLADDLGITVNGKDGVKTVDGYLQTVEMLRKSTWGSSLIPKITGDQNLLRCWKGRVAMIDSIYYEPI
jgi:HKD family nuclease